MTIVRLLNLMVIAALVFAAAYVYTIKFDSTLQAERVAKVRREIRQEREAIASLRAETAMLENAGRIQGLATRHLKLQAAQAHQFELLDNLPERPPDIVPPDSADPIGAYLELPEGEANSTTGSISNSAGER